jgi:hypothetical protein
MAWAMYERAGRRLVHNTSNIRRLIHDDKVEEGRIVELYTVGHVEPDKLVFDTRDGAIDFVRDVIREVCDTP